MAKTIGLIIGSTVVGIIAYCAMRLIGAPDWAACIAWLAAALVVVHLGDKT